MNMPEKIRSFTNRWAPVVVFFLTFLSGASLVFTAAAWHTLDGRYVTKSLGEKEFATKTDFILLKEQVKQVTVAAKNLADAADSHAKDKTLHMPDQVKFSTFVSRPEYDANNALIRDDRDRERAHTDEKFHMIMGALERLQDTVEDLRD